MEQDRTTPPPKLADIAKRDFVEASEVLVSFPEQWEHLGTLETAYQRLYLAGFPIERAHPSRNHFEGLRPEINVSLVFYRLYKFFQPWPMPRATVEWNASRQCGHVTDRNGRRVQLQPVGQAQAWFGVDHAVLWECYLDSSRRNVNSTENLKALWQHVEEDVGAPKLFTWPDEPAFEGNYKEYLQGEGYRGDPENEGWWSKRSDVRRVSVFPSD